MSSINTNPNQAGNREFQNNNWHRGLWKSVLWQLVNGQEIAVKTLSTTSHQTEQEFFNEVTKFYSLKFLNVKSSKKLSRFICLCLLCQMNSYVIFTIGSNDLFLAD